MYLFTPSKWVAIMDAGGFTVRLSSDVKETNQNGDAKKDGYHVSCYSSAPGQY